MIRLKRLYAHNFKQLKEIELRLPDRARILVQGKNEAGKSTLFEAVFFALFGNALATEAGGRGLDGLIAYEAEKARVELDLECRDRLFKITRTVVRGKPNVWELDIQREGEIHEEVRGNVAINRRLIAELGFDGEALLNSCFVEQKKLEKLEGLSRAKREESLAKLLNLDRVMDLENSLKIRSEDKQELDRLKKRAELAQVQTDLPANEKELAAVEGKLKLIELWRSVHTAAEEMRGVQLLEQDICARVAERDAAAQRVERIEALKEAMLGVKEARDAVERADENAREIERLRGRQAERDRAEVLERSLDDRAAALRRVSVLVHRLDQIRTLGQANEERVRQLTAAQIRLAELNRAIEDDRKILTHLNQLWLKFQVGEALGNWIAARETLTHQDVLEKQLEEKQVSRDRISRRFQYELFAAVFFFLALLGLAALAHFDPLVVMVFALGALVLVFARMAVLWRDLSCATEALGLAQGEAHSLSMTAEAAKLNLQQTESHLKEWNVPVPESVELAQSQRVTLAREMENKTADELKAEQESTRERLLRAQAVVGELRRQYSIENPDLTRVREELSTARKLSAKAATLLTQYQPLVEELTHPLGVEPVLEVIQRGRYQVDLELRQIREQINQAAGIDQDLARREEQGQFLAARARESYERARRLAKGETPAWSMSLTAADYTAFGKSLRAEYDGLGGEGAVKRAREIEGELGRRQGELETRRRGVAAYVSRIHALLSDLGQTNALSDVPTVDELDELRSRLDSVDVKQEPSLQAQQRHLVGQVHSLRDRQTQLNRELGLGGELLDLAATRAEYQAQVHAAQVRENGAEILSLTRKRIVQKVLPATMDYMRRILPPLTQDRYHDAQLDEDTYRIQVWDERAGQGGAFKEKNIFSGGTRDQFSLALRLAFALATMPHERGSAPSFIFLDEPLSSFDEERAEALIYLLTEGEIAQAFDQIFLISHVHVDERLFTHRVLLEHGRVAYTDLPEASVIG